MMRINRGNTVHRSRAWLWGWYLVFRGSDTSGNYQHRGRKGKKGGSLPGGGHGAIGIASDASKDQKRQAIDQHQEQAAKEKGKLGPLIRKRIARTQAQIRAELDQAHEANEATWKELDDYQNKNVIPLYAEMDRIKAEGKVGEAEWKDLVERHTHHSAVAADLFEAHTETAKRKYELERALRENGLKQVEVPAGQQANVSLSTRIRDGREEAQAGLDIFNRLVGTGTVNGERVDVGRRNTDRACYTPLHFHKDAGKVMLSKGDRRGVMLHEMGHWLEDRDPAIHQKALAFLARRTKGETAQKLADIYPRDGYKDYEITKRDRFQHAYTGKVYDSGRHGQYATEIISMGLQHMYENAEKFAQRDPGFFDFMIEVLRGGG